MMMNREKLNIDLLDCFTPHVGEQVQIRVQVIPFQNWQSEFTGNDNTESTIIQAINNNTVE